MSIVEARDLAKAFQVPEREAGLVAALTSLVRRKHRLVRAVDGINFSLEAGEVVGFLGPNGAGKTTTLKMLAGLLVPTSGEVRVLGYVPSRRRTSFLSQITLIMGQRNQLLWDIPAIDSFELQRAIYQIPADAYRRNRDELVELLDLGELVHKPVRNLSLGERMKVEIAAALLHQPKVLFLDEPTIGLDVTAQRRIRRFLAEYNQRHNATVLLTSHYMADVEALCRRVLVIHHGRLVFDGHLSAMVERFATHKTLRVTLAEVSPLRRPGAAEVRFQDTGTTVVSQESSRLILRVPKDAVADVTSSLLSDEAALDLVVEDPPIDDVIEAVFARPAAGTDAEEEAEAARLEPADG